MATSKTTETELSVEAFLEKVSEEQVRDDCRAIIRLMKKVTGFKPKMWGTAIIGFGSYHYTYDSGREGDMCLAGFSPRKQNISLYLKAGLPGQEDLLKKFGKHKVSKGCMYIRKLEDIDPGILEKLVKGTVDYLQKKYPDK